MYANFCEQSHGLLFFTEEICNKRSFMEVRTALLHQPLQLLSNMCALSQPNDVT